MRFCCGRDVTQSCFLLALNLNFDPLTCATTQDSSTRPKARKTALARGHLSDAVLSALMSEDDIDIIDGGDSGILIIDSDDDKIEGQSEVRPFLAACACERQADLSFFVFRFNECFNICDDYTFPFGFYLSKIYI